MKKTYMQPTISVAKIDTCTICAGSGITISDDGKSGSGALNPGEASGDGLAKETFWDADWN